LSGYLSGEILACDLIDVLCRVNGISKKYILISLQREQSLVQETSREPKNIVFRTDWALGLGRMDDLQGNKKVLESRRGFYQQLSLGVPRLRVLFDEFASSKKVLKIRGEEYSIPSALTWVQLRWTPNLDVLNFNYDKWKKLWPGDIDK
jgi:hypothetical protein